MVLQASSSRLLSCFVTDLAIDSYCQLYVFEHNARSRGQTSEMFASETLYFQHLSRTRSDSGDELEFGELVRFGTKVQVMMRGLNSGTHRMKSKNGVEDSNLPTRVRG